jgi:hypothetical protein
VNSRFPVNATPRGMGRPSLPSSCVSPSLGEMSDEKWQIGSTDDGPYVGTRRCMQALFNQGYIFRHRCVEFEWCRKGAASEMELCVNTYANCVVCAVR